MSDYAHDAVDTAIADLQKDIEAVYSKCAKDMEAEALTYWDKLELRKAKMYEKLQDGVIDKKQYQTWLTAQIGRGKNLDVMAQNLANTLYDANYSALQMSNMRLPTAYSISRNWTNYQIEKMADNPDLSFSLYDERTIMRLIKDEPDLMPSYFKQNLKLDKLHNLSYSKKKIRENITSGILQGKSIPDIAKSLGQDISDMGKVSATRAARTAMTGAENAGRLDSYNEAISIGIKVKKMWMSAHDRRTRASHIQLDGIVVDVDKLFPNKLEYPADPFGRPEEVYNCRCTMVAVLPETKKDWKEYNKDNHTVTSYKAWEKQKKEEQKRRAEERKKKAAEKEQKRLESIKDNTFQTNHLRDTLGQDACDDLDYILEHCGNDDVLALYKNNRDKLKVHDTNAKRQRYLRVFRSVEINLKNNTDPKMLAINDKRKHQSTFHEFGHLIDHALGKGDYLSTEWKNGKLIKDLRSDLLLFWTDKSGKTEAEINSNDFARLVKDATGYNDFLHTGALSDIYGFVTLTNMGYCGGHKSTYYVDNPDWIAVEYFAEMCESITANHDQLKVLETVLPNSCSDFYEMIKGVIKK